ncbi:MAG: hypothetical protein WBD27_11510 [Pyrinomonadaceae bacterium]
MTSRHQRIDVLMLQFIAFLMYSVIVMRTTLTIDDDVAFGLRKAHENAPDRSFKEIVNEVLRKGLVNNPVPKSKRFKVKTFSLGLREGLSLDNIEELLDQVEGPFRK